MPPAPPSSTPPILEERRWTTAPPLLSVRVGMASRGGRPAPLLSRRRPAPSAPPPPPGASGVVLDAAGNAWVTGATGSVDFPVTVGAFDRTPNGMADVFVSELSADGSTLIYSTYLGGTQSESGADLALDAGGNVYIAGH